MNDKSKRIVLWFEELDKNDIPLVGGKNANLGELMSKAKVPVPPGFAVTAYAYRRFIEDTGIRDEILRIVKNTDVNNTEELENASKQIRKLIETTPMPDYIKNEIINAYEELCKREGADEVLVATRSSATAEDLPGASFAGQQETYLNVGRADLLEKIQKCWGSLFTPRAIFYREEKGFEHDKVLISVAVQKMVDARTAGVMFTLHPSTGDRTKIMIEGSWGLGEAVVSGSVTPDTFVVDKQTMKIVQRHIASKKVQVIRDPKTGKTVKTKVPKNMQEKPSLSDEEVIELAKYGLKIENHYGRPMDIEWAIENGSNKIYILQARPETVFSEGGSQEMKAAEELPETVEKKVLVQGLPASPGIAIGKVKVILDVKDIHQMREGEILVTTMTTPDWVPAMRKAAAIITDEGGFTAHAAIVSRELGIPCIVGTGNATKVLKTGQVVTVDAKRGVVYEGAVEEYVKKKKEEAAAPATVAAPSVPVTGTKIYINLGVPEKAEEYAKLPVDGVGLMREEFIVATYIGKHPMKLIEEGNEQVFIDKLAEGIATVARAFYPRPVVLRFSDFKTNEYRKLEGGEKYEIEEENPMLGWRGQSRYVDPDYEPAFRLELKAIKKVREEMKLTNVWVMIPFVRTIDNLKKVLKIMEEEGLKRGPDFKVWLMAEVPSNIFLVDKFCEYIDGFSIGSNDLTQLILGVDRESGKLAYLFDERNLAVRRAIKYLIKQAHKRGKTVSICGQAPSTKEGYLEFLVRSGIDSISVNPDVAIEARKKVAQIEQRIMMEKLLGHFYEDTDENLPK
ncbi:MAG: phosphoenolpyruvate synthase [Candidatus Asgardarchaeia archaeon]